MRTRASLSTLLLLALGVTLAARPAVGQDRLINIPRSGTYNAVVGDYIQVKYLTAAVPGRTGELRVDVRGDGVQKISVFGGAIPGRPVMPGGESYLIVLFRCERTGSSTIRIEELAIPDQKVLDTTNLVINVTDMR